MFIGQKEVSVIGEALGKTPAGAELVKVDYIDGTGEILPKVMYEKLLSLEPRDATSLRDMRIAIMTQQIFSVMQEYGMKYSELSYLGSMLLSSVEKNKGAADKCLWKKPFSEITMLDINDIVKENPEVLKDFLSGGE